MAIRALLLDFDGTLADSLPALRRVYERFVGDLGGESSGEEFDSLNGPPLSEVVQQLCLTHQGRNHSAEDLETYQGLIAAQLAHTKPATGAQALLAEAKARGIRCAVVTSGKADLVQDWLRAFGFGDQFDLIISGDDVKQGKPSPQPYRLAVQTLGIRPDECLAIEDSSAGVAAAMGAGIPTLHLANAASGDSEAHRIATLDDAVPFLRGIAR